MVGRRIAALLVTMLAMACASSATRKGSTTSRDFQRIRIRVETLRRHDLVDFTSTHRSGSTSAGFVSLRERLAYLGAPAIHPQALYEQRGDRAAMKLIGTSGGSRFDPRSDCGDGWTTTYGGWYIAVHGSEDGYAGVGTGPGIPSLSVDPFLVMDRVSWGLAAVDPDERQTSAGVTLRVDSSDLRRFGAPRAKRELGSWMSDGKGVRIDLSAVGSTTVRAHVEARTPVGTDRFTMTLTPGSHHRLPPGCLPS